MKHIQSICWYLLHHRDIEGLCKWRLLGSVICLHCGCPGHSYSAPDWFCISSSKWPMWSRVPNADMHNEAPARCWKVDIWDFVHYILWTRTLATETGNQLWSPNHFECTLTVRLLVLWKMTKWKLHNLSLPYCDIYARCTCGTRCHERRWCV